MLVTGKPIPTVTNEIIYKILKQLSHFLLGQVITHWSAIASDSVLQGGMTYSNGYITVPESGIYFIYFNFYTSTPITGKPYRSINVDSRMIGLSYHKISEEISISFGLLWNVKKGNRLSVRTHGGSVRYYFSPHNSWFGAWKVN